MRGCSVITYIDWNSGTCLNASLLCVCSVPEVIARLQEEIARKDEVIDRLQDE